MKFIYPAIFSKDADGVFHGYFPDLEDCLSTGETLDEAIENANEAACNWLSVELEEDGPSSTCFRSCRPGTEGRRNHPQYCRKYPLIRWI